LVIQTQLQTGAGGSTDLAVSSPVAGIIERRHISGREEIEAARVRFQPFGIQPPGGRIADHPAE
jgi:hypothetical protein